jgi:diguanylate cyclase (GGDEF)-like protein
MFVAVVSLGTLAVWSAIVTQNGAQDLSQAGVQTSGHLRALQALSLIDTSTDALEKGPIPRELAKLRHAQRLLDESLLRMEAGGVEEALRIARIGKPLARQLNPAVEEFLAVPPGFDSDGSSGPEERMEDILDELMVVLNDLDADASQHLTEQLDAVTDRERAVRATAFILIPLGLGGVAGCAWLLSYYRRRAAATMLSALSATAEEARTDELTGLPNRRALLEALESQCREGKTFMLTLADLDGFKHYNDTFGHTAGDALLRRLAIKLTRATEGIGLAARLGGDEFCVLFYDGLDPREAQRITNDALQDEGEGFLIGSCTGVASVPREVSTPDAALRLADSRMYASKDNASGRDAGLAVAGALTRMLDERHPGIGSHLEEVAILAAACAEKLGLGSNEVRTIKRAAELHDIGKVAIPSEILSKRGRLDTDEWAFMKRHSIIGERILAGVPSLENAAAIVRSSHERFDGTGYPDQLQGDQITLGARIVFVADAFCAMTEERSYAAALSVDDACAELNRCAETHFDPTVVKAFIATLEDREQGSNESGATLRVPVLT